MCYHSLHLSLPSARLTLSKIGVSPVCLILTGLCANESVYWPSQFGPTHFVHDKIIKHQNAQGDETLNFQKPMLVLVTGDTEQKIASEVKSHQDYLTYITVT